MTTVVAFDVNETLLDLRALDPAFEELLGSAALRGQWFAQTLQLSFVARPGMVLSPIGAEPDIVGPDITTAVDQIVAVDAQ